MSKPSSKWGKPRRNQIDWPMTILTAGVVILAALVAGQLLSALVYG